MAVPQELGFRLLTSNSYWVPHVAGPNSLMLDQIPEPRRPSYRGKISQEIHPLITQTKYLHQVIVGVSWTRLTTIAVPWYERDQKKFNALAWWPSFQIEEAKTEPKCKKCSLILCMCCVCWHKVFQWLHSVLVNSVEATKNGIFWRKQSPQETYLPCVQEGDNYIQW